MTEYIGQEQYRMDSIYPGKYPSPYDSLAEPCSDLYYHRHNIWYAYHPFALIYNRCQFLSDALIIYSSVSTSKYRKHLRHSIFSYNYTFLLIIFIYPKPVEQSASSNILS